MEITCWDTWIRTTIKGFKGLCPTIRRYPNLYLAGSFCPKICTSASSKGNSATNARSMF